MRFPSLLLAISLSLFSRTTSASSTGAVEEAEARFQTGLSLAAQGSWDHARLAFLQAYVVLPSSTELLWNLAYAEFKSGRALDPIGHFKAYERDPKAEPARLAVLPKLRERAYQQIGRVKVQAPPGAILSIDGSPRAWVEPIDVQPGDHKIEARVGEHAEERSFSILAGQVLEIPFTLAGAPATPTPSAPGSVTPLPLEAPKTEGSVRYWAAGGVGAVAVAAAAIGLGFGLAANSEKSGVAAKRTQFGPACPSTSAACEEWRNEASAQRTHVDLARGFLFGSAVLASAAALTLALWPHARTSVAVLPGTLAVSTRF